MAAGLTALMILLFLGNWRLTLIILASIPLSIITAVLFMYVGGADAQHHDARRLCAGGRHPGRQRHGGHREHRAARRPETSRCAEAIVDGAGEVGMPTLLSTLCICIVFVPVFLLQGTAKYLFSPLSLSVIVSLLASLALSFTLVPVLFKYLMRASRRAASRRAQHRAARRAPPRAIRSWRDSLGFERGFERFRESYRNALAWTLSAAGADGRRSSPC